MPSQGFAFCNSSPYENLSLTVWLDSFDSLEGVPSWPSTRESAGEIELHRPWQQTLNRWFDIPERLNLMKGFLALQKRPGISHSKVVGRYGISPV